MLSPESDIHYFHAKASHAAKGGGKYGPIACPESWELQYLLSNTSDYHIY